MRFWMTVTLVAGLASAAAAQELTTPSAPDGLIAPNPAAPADGKTGSPAADADLSSLSMQEVIGRQLDAFNARDIDLAWQFASPMIRSLFGTPQNFGTMVNRAYPMVWDNSATRFVATRQSDAVTFQQVMVQDTNGKLHLLEYAMIKTSDGWKIDGVFLLPPPDVGT